MQKQKSISESKEKSTNPRIFRDYGRNYVPKICTQTLDTTFNRGLGIHSIFYL